MARRLKSIDLALIALLVVLVTPVAPVLTVAGQTAEGLRWVRQFGTTAPDQALGVAAAASGIYVTGLMIGSYPGDAYDAFLRRYDRNGAVIWMRSIATDSFDYGNAVAADAERAYVVGHTGGALAGGSPGSVDAYVRAFDLSGNVLWTGEFGDAYNFDSALGVAADATGVYVVGRTEGTLPGEVSSGGYDLFIRKYDFIGNVSWTHQFGTVGYEQTAAVAVDPSGVYVAGDANGVFPGEVGAGGGDAFLRKYDTAGTVIWTRQFGTDGNDGGYAVATDPSGVYVAGLTVGTFAGETKSSRFPSGDAFLVKYDSSGRFLWARQFGSSVATAAFAVAADTSGVYVAGQTDGALPGASSSGGTDAFVRQYDPSGHAIGNLEFGTASYDRAFGIAVDTTGIYVAGMTAGTFEGETNAGDVDSFLAVPNQPLPAPPQGAPEGMPLVLGIVEGVAIVSASLTAALLARWWIHRKGAD